MLAFCSVGNTPLEALNMLNVLRLAGNEPLNGFALFGKGNGLFGEVVSRP